MFGFLALKHISGPHQTDSERRRGGRLACESLSCEAGDVIDIAPGGLRTRSRKHPKLDDQQEVTLTIEGAAGSLEVRAKVLRIVKGPSGFETALRFTEPTPALASSLRRLAVASAPDACRRA